MTVTRESVRALVIDEHDRILLSRVTPLDSAIARDLWVTFGGRVKEDEESAAALKRELEEELAETRYEIGQKVWLGDEVVNWGGNSVRLREHFYLVRVQAKNYVFVGEDHEETSSTHEVRWWKASEIENSDAKFVPWNLGRLLKELVAKIPSEPILVQLEVKV